MKAAKEAEKAAIKAAREAEKAAKQGTRKATKQEAEETASRRQTRAGNKRKTEGEDSNRGKGNSIVLSSLTNVASSLGATRMMPEQTGNDFSASASGRLCDLSPDGGLCHLC